MKLLIKQRLTSPHLLLNETQLAEYHRKKVNTDHSILSDHRTGSPSKKAIKFNFPRSLVKQKRSIPQSPTHEGKSPPPITAVSRVFSPTSPTADNVSTDPRIMSPLLENLLVPYDKMILANKQASQGVEKNRSSVTREHVRRNRNQIGNRPAAVNLVSSPRAFSSARRENARQNSRHPEKADGINNTTGRKEHLNEKNIPEKQEEEKKNPKVDYSEMNDYLSRVHSADNLRSDAFFGKMLRNYRLQFNEARAKENPLESPKFTEDVLHRQQVLNPLMMRNVKRRNRPLNYYTNQQREKMDSFLAKYHRGEFSEQAMPKIPLHSGSFMTDSIPSEMSPKTLHFFDSIVQAKRSPTHGMNTSEALFVVRNIVRYYNTYVKLLKIPEIIQGHIEKLIISLPDFHSIVFYQDGTIKMGLREDDFFSYLKINRNKSIRASMSPTAASPSHFKSALLKNRRVDPQKSQFLLSLNNELQIKLTEERVENIERCSKGIVEQLKSNKKRIAYLRWKARIMGNRDDLNRLNNIIEGSFPAKPMVDVTLPLPNEFDDKNTEVAILNAKALSKKLDDNLEMLHRYDYLIKKTQEKTGGERELEEEDEEGQEIKEEEPEYLDTINKLMRLRKYGVNINFPKKH